MDALSILLLTTCSLTLPCVIKRAVKHFKQTFLTGARTTANEHKMLKYCFMVGLLVSGILLALYNNPVYTIVLIVMAYVLLDSESDPLIQALINNRKVNKRDRK